MTPNPLDLALAPLRTGRRVVTRSVNRFISRRDQPVVLMHGFLGFNHFGPLEYFAGVRELLEMEGFHAHAPTVNPLNRLEYRAYEWVYGRPPETEDPSEADRAFRPRDWLYRRTHPRYRPHLAEIYLRHRRPLHLITHSQGSLDARYLLSPRGMGSWQPYDDATFPAELRELRIRDLVASVCAVAGPHNGILYADDEEVSIWLLREMMNPAFNRVVSALSHDRSDAEGTIREFGRRYMLEFNRLHPDPEGIRLYSVAGSANRFQVTFFLRPFFEQIRYNPRFELDDNDGLVPVCSAKWPVTEEADLPRELEPEAVEGDLWRLRYPHQPELHGAWSFLGLIYADHVNQIGMPVAYPRNHIFRHLHFYGGLARFLHGELDPEVKLQANGTWAPEPEVSDPHAVHRSPAPQAPRVTDR